MSRSVLEMWVIYERPKDYPQGFVARRWLIAAGEPRPTSVAFVADTLEGARAQLPPGLFRMDRQPDDEPQIVEVWL